MAQVAGTTDTLDLIGIAEDVEDMIYTISPTDTPFFTMAKRGRVSNTLHQWQTDTLGNGTANFQIEGDDATFTTAAPTVMLSNRTSIATKTLVVSRTADRVRKYGRAKETARLLVKYGKQMKLDIETMALGVQGSSAGNSTALARYTAGFGAMVANNASKLAGTASTAPGYSSSDWGTSVDGTARSALTEGHLKAALELAWTDGGDPSQILMGTFQKKAVASFAGASKFAGSYATQNRTQQGIVVAGVDLYISDFGEHQIRLSRQIPTSRIYCIDPEYVEIGWLDPIKTEPLAKTGDAEKAMLVGEWTLVLGNPDAHAQIYALSTS